jgi:hypothetical protein
LLSPSGKLLFEADSHFEQPVDFLAAGDALKTVKQLDRHWSLRELYVKDWKLGALDAMEDRLIFARGFFRAAEISVA